MRELGPADSACGTSLLSPCAGFRGGVGQRIPDAGESFGLGLRAHAYGFAASALLVELGLASAHPLGGQLAAVEGFRLRMDAPTLPVDPDLSRVP